MMYQWICRYWLPAGFLCFLTGLFLSPSAHNYKVIINYMLLLPGLVAACAVWKWWVPTPRNRTLLLLVFVYLLYMAVNAYGQNAQEGVEFTQWSFYILVFLFAGGLCMDIRQQTFTQLLWLGVIAATSAAVYAIVRDLASGAMFQPLYRLIGYGPLYNPLRSAHLFGVFLIMAVWCALVARVHIAQRWFAAVCAAIILTTMLLTGSRSPLLALLLVSLWLVAVAVPSKRRLHYLSGLLAITIPAAILFWGELLERGWSLRPELWKLAATAALEHPWFGVGLGNRIVLDSSIGMQFYDTHNVFLAVLYYGGLCGLLLFAALFGYAFCSAWSRRQQSPLFGLAATLQVYGLATLQFDGGSLIGRPTEFWLLYWLPMVVTLFTGRYCDENGNSLPANTFSD